MTGGGRGQKFVKMDGLLQIIILPYNGKLSKQNSIWPWDNQRTMSHLCLFLFLLISFIVVVVVGVVVVVVDKQESPAAFKTCPMMAQLKSH